MEYLLYYNDYYGIFFLRICTLNKSSEVLSGKLPDFS